MILYGIATRHEAHEFWTLEPRLYETREGTERHAAEVWGGVDKIAARVVGLPASEVEAKR